MFFFPDLESNTKKRQTRKKRISSHTIHNDNAFFRTHIYGTDSYTKLKGRAGGMGENWRGSGENPTLDTLVKHSLSTVFHHRRNSQHTFCQAQFQ